MVVIVKHSQMVMVYLKKFGKEKMITANFFQVTMELFLKKEFNKRLILN